MVSYRGRTYAEGKKIGWKDGVRALYVSGGFKRASTQKAIADAVRAAKAKGLPVTTGPWQVTAANPQQKVFDRRATWWAAEKGLAPMPQVLRNIWLPTAGEQQTAQLLITNQVDAGTGNVAITRLSD